MCKMPKILTDLPLICIFFVMLNDRIVDSDKNNPNSVKVNKCCETSEILVDLRCTHVNEANTSRWSPVFNDYRGEGNVQVDDFWIAVGIPQCIDKQMWPIYSNHNSRDKLELLPDGKLRHFIRNSKVDEDDIETIENSKSEPSKWLHYYSQGQYCMDKAISSKGFELPSEFAMVCSPQRDVHWTDTDFLLQKIVNPLCHSISVAILLIVAIIYFVLPTLRDLVGNIITTLAVCLVVHQVANLIRIFTEFSNHINFMLLDIFAHVSLMAAFFWLNALGYYIWKTFRSRNVFLRVTDGKKYCYYSFYVWLSTICVAALGMIAHFFLETDDSKRNFVIEEQETIGWLGMTVFFTPIAIIIILNIYFYVSTQNLLSSRMHASYGRIHYKLKANFVMFTLLSVLMSISWLFSLFSWLEYNSVFYMSLVTNAIEAPLILYICVLRQTHVTYLLQKSCCTNQPPSAADWGDELSYMRDGHHHQSTTIIY